MTSMMELIRQGVKLRSVSENTDHPQSLAPPSATHTQQLQEALLRISSRLQMSDEEESENCGEDDFDED